jgi:Domain of unknown function (DUF4259)
MGFWGLTTFENDDAMDWIEELQEHGSLEFLAASLTPEEVDGFYLEAPEGVGILCAAEVIAGAISDDTSSLPEEARSWLAENSGLDFSSLASLAQSKLDRVLAEHSELYELWQEDPATVSQQQNAVAHLRGRFER